MKNLIFVSTILFTACAHQDVKSRMPATANAISEKSSGDVKLHQIFQNAMAKEAILFGEPNAQGTREAICTLNVSGRPDLVPKFITPASNGKSLGLKLPVCDENQTAQVSQVANEGTQPEYAAGGPMVSAIECAVSFALTAAIVAAVNHTGDSFTARNAPAYSVGLSSGLAIARATVVPRMLANGLIGAVCSGIGISVGYWLVPFKSENGGVK